jgi:hypothetical protein
MDSCTNLFINCREILSAKKINGNKEIYNIIALIEKNESDSIDSANIIELRNNYNSEKNKLEQEAKLLDIKQKTQKIFLNSIYGAFGNKYFVLGDDDLARSITRSKMGIVWHTTYNGSAMADMEASFGADISKFKNSTNVWYRDASFVDATGTATFTKQETDTLNSTLSQAGSLFRTISARTLNIIATNDTYKIAIKAWNNSKVREGKEITNTSQHVAGLISSMEEKLNKSILEAKKADTRQKREMEKKVVMEFYKSNKNELKKIFDLQNLLVRAKNMIVRKLQQVQDSVGTYLRTDATGLKVTAPEGFVAIDKIGNAVKLVDRLEFSQANFNATKNWSK